MRIVIDLQGAQSKGSCNRGIGRYSLSLAQAIVRNRGIHEVFIALKGGFPDTIEHIRSVFDGLLPQENIRVWNLPGSVCAIIQSNTWRREATELLREAFLASLKPDVVLVSSLFEGLGDDAVTSIGVFTCSLPTAVVLYDLIPLIHPKPYLENPIVQSWYLNKIEHLRRADVWLAISESSRQEGISYLGLPKTDVVNISTDADNHFQRIVIPSEDEGNLRLKYGLTKPFLMYTGGIDHRKNIERLIRAFAILPTTIRQNYQLAIICSVHPDTRQALDKIARQQGLKANEIIFTGFIPEEDLVAFYNLCKLFIFPSWHEGFGLPALEAMRCGAPVIAANTSSLPEVIGREDALFDPFSEESIAAKITEVLTNDSLLESLRSHATKQANSFSWDKSAKKAIAAFERLNTKNEENCAKVQVHPHRPKMAYISPLPPERSGIADYSAELLPELAGFYDIDVIVAQSEVSDPWIKACLPIRTVEWFIEHADQYDRILYHFGNSPFHQHMFDLLDQIPGIVVLHDFFLSGILAHLELTGTAPGAWSVELYKSHGYSAVWKRFHTKDMEETIFKFPCNFSTLQRAVGLITHSNYSISLAQECYSKELVDKYVKIPLLRVPVSTNDRIGARRTLGLVADDFIVCSFGHLGSTKQNHRLLNAWMKSSLARDQRCQLIFVGENEGGIYGKQMLDTIYKSGIRDRIRITGWVGKDDYRYYLASADIAVQLRSHSRGETSAAILDCMNNGLATIINANGSNTELPDDAVWMLPDDFDDTDLILALEALWGDTSRRQKLGTRAREVILTRHAPHTCAEQYVQAIEKFYANAQTGRKALINTLARLEKLPSDNGTLVTLATAIAQNLPSKHPAHQLMVDITGLVQQDGIRSIQHMARCILKELLQNPPPGYRVEPVYVPTGRSGYHYARNFTLHFIDCPFNGLPDDPIEFRSGDILIGLAPQTHISYVQEEALESLRLHGIGIYFVIDDTHPILLPQDNIDNKERDLEKWLNSIVRFDGVLCTSIAGLGEFIKLLEKNGPKRLRPLKIGQFHLCKEVANVASTRDLPNEMVQVLNQHNYNSDDESCLSWEQSTQQMLDLIFKGKWYTEWSNNKNC
ncbi:glycosyltransferase [Methanocalculus natronophilus]|uniref:glycosyltransferase n=1 Tax=Methanocalculus natronophilus TaxID=1262400 RepID=UPI0031B6370C